MTQGHDLYDVTPRVRQIHCPERIARLCQRDRYWVDSMMIHRHSAQTFANMTAYALHELATVANVYQCSITEGLTLVDADTPAIVPDEVIAAHSSDYLPPHTLLLVDWDSHAVIAGGDENILGDNVTLKVETSAQNVSVPIIEATNESLLHYGAMLFDDGDCLKFGTDNYPLWKMSLGQDYVDGFLMTEQGKGFYLEWHTDRPHWHQPVTEDACGFYLLAKLLGKMEDGRQLLQLTGFKIPFGKAVYTSPGAIHCDAALTGKNWVVGFTDSQEYSTALIRNRFGSMLKISS